MNPADNNPSPNPISDSPPPGGQPDAGGVGVATASVPSFGVSDDSPPTPAFQAVSDSPSANTSTPEPGPPPADTSTPPQTPPATNSVLGGPTSASEDPPVATSGQSGGGSRKKILAALAVVLMVFGIGAGVFIVRNQQVGQSFAWDCSLYTFTLDDNGTVSVQNGSGRNEPGQQARVFINNNLVETFDVPALNSGEGATLGTVSLPSNQSYSWRIEGSKDCDDQGSKQVSEITASCSEVVAYDEEWAELTTTDLAALEEGDVVRFAVSGTASSGTIDMARFSVNGGSFVEVTDLRPGSDDFYYEYTIPEGVNSFNVSAEVFHSELGWF